MELSFQLHPFAQQEYLTSYLWYDEQKAGLGERFAGVIRNRIQQIANNPEQYSKKKRIFREVFVETFPFVIVYTIDKKNKALVIVSIFHTGRNPKTKYRKL